MFTFWLANDRLAGVTLIAGLAADTPVPLSARLCEGLDALSVNVTVPDRAPVVTGLN